MPKEQDSSKIDETVCPPEGEITRKYDLSIDGAGLLKYIRSEAKEDIFYHVHSAEMTILEKWIHNILLTNKHLRACAKCLKMPEGYDINDDATTEFTSTSPVVVSTERVWKRYRFNHPFLSGFIWAFVFFAWGFLLGGIIISIISTRGG